MSLQSVCKVPGTKQKCSSKENDGIFYFGTENEKKVPLLILVDMHYATSSLLVVFPSMLRPVFPLVQRLLRLLFNFFVQNALDVAFIFLEWYFCVDRLTLLFWPLHFCFWSLDISVLGRLTFQFCQLKMQFWPLHFCSWSLRHHFETTVQGGLPKFPFSIKESRLYNNYQ